MKMASVIGSKEYDGVLLKIKADERIIDASQSLVQFLDYPVIARELSGGSPAEGLQIRGYPVIAITLRIPPGCGVRIRMVLVVGFEERQKEKKRLIPMIVDIPNGQIGLSVNTKSRISVIPALFVKKMKIVSVRCEFQDIRAPPILAASLMIPGNRIVGFRAVG